MAAAGAVAAILVVIASLLAAMLRAGPVLAAAGIVAAILVASAVALADALETVTSIRTATVRVEPDEDVVDAAFHLTALAEAADPSLRAFVIRATLGANSFMRRFAANQPVATVELWWPVSRCRCNFQQAACFARWNAALVIAHAGAFLTALAEAAIRVETTLGADQLAFDTAVDLTQWARECQWHTDVVFTGRA